MHVRGLNVLAEFCGISPWNSQFCRENWRKISEGQLFTTPCTCTFNSWGSVVAEQPGGWMSDSCRMYKSFALCCCRVRGSGQATHSHLILPPSCIYTGGWVVMLRSWGGNRRSGIAMAIRHRLWYQLSVGSKTYDIEMSTHAYGPMACGAFTYLIGSKTWG